MKPIARWRAPWKRMTSITPLGRRAKRARAGRKESMEMLGETKKIN